jgi:hypothetical protein
MTKAFCPGTIVGLSTFVSLNEIVNPEIAAYKIVIFAARNISQVLP